MTPEEEIVYLEGVKSYVNQRIQKLKEKLRNDKRPKLEGHKLSFSGLYVQSICLVPYINKWIEDGGSIIQLAAKSEVSDTLIRRMRNKEIEWTRDEMAEKIMVKGLGLNNEYNELERVRLKRKYNKLSPEPESQYYEE